jgi:hypothetical protein
VILSRVFQPLASDLDAYQHEEAGLGEAAMLEGAGLHLMPELTSHSASHCIYTVIAKVDLHFSARFLLTNN